MLKRWGVLILQARVEEVGQALLRRTQDAGGVGPRRKGKRSRFHMDAYEEHMLLPEVLCHAILCGMSYKVKAHYCSQVWNLLKHCLENAAEVLSAALRSA